MVWAIFLLKLHLMLFFLLIYLNFEMSYKVINILFFRFLNLDYLIIIVLIELNFTTNLTFLTFIINFYI